MRNNTKEVKAAVKAHILARIDLSGYEMDNTIQNLFEVFKSEYGWNIKQQGEKKAFIEWLSGAPTALGIEIYHDQVREVLINEFKTNTPAKRDDTKSWNFYLHMICVGVKELLDEPKKESSRMLRKIEKTFNNKS